MVARVGWACASIMKVDGGLAKVGCRASLVVGRCSEFSSVLCSPFGLKREQMGTAPAQGLELKQRAELKSSWK